MTKVLFYKDDPDLFLRLIDPEKFLSLDRTSFPLWSRYYQTYFGAALQDLSFCIIENNRAETYTPCQSIDGQIFNNGTAISVHTSTHTSKNSVRDTLNILEELLRSHNIDSTEIVTAPQNNRLDLLGECLFQAGLSPMVEFLSVIDLTLPEAEIRKRIRKSYIPLINWGEKNLNIIAINAANLNKTLFDQVRDFHAIVAGRITRSIDSWEIQYEMIEKGQAELLVGFLNEDMVSASFCTHQNRFTLYGVGIYDRTKFEKPLAHALMYRAILNAKNQGQKRFLVGDVPQRNDDNQKLFQIGKFKKGFSDSLELQLKWSIRQGIAGNMI